MMSAHVVLGSLDAANAATLSRRLLVGELRDELHFGGVCFTDCMQMHAIARTVGRRPAPRPRSPRAPTACSSATPRARAGGCRAHRPRRSAAAACRSRCPDARAARDVTAPLPLDAPPPEAGIGLEIARRAVTLLRAGRAPTRQAAPWCRSKARRTTARPIPPKRSRRCARRSPRWPKSAYRSTPRATALPRCSNGSRDGIRRVDASRAPLRIAASRDSCDPRTLSDATIVAVRSPFDLECASGARHALATYGANRSACTDSPASCSAGSLPAARFRWSSRMGVDDVLRAACGRSLRRGGARRTGRSARVRARIRRNEGRRARGSGLRGHAFRSRVADQDSRRRWRCARWNATRSRSTGRSCHGSGVEGRPHAAITLRMLLAHTSGMNSARTNRSCSQRVDVERSRRSEISSNLR